MRYYLLVAAFAVALSTTGGSALAQTYGSRNRTVIYKTQGGSLRRDHSAPQLVVETLPRVYVGKYPVTPRRRVTRQTYRYSSTVNPAIGAIVEESW